MANAPALSRPPRIGPEHHGRRMSLERFAHAEPAEGHLYELENGVVVVDVPGIPHSFVVAAIRSALELYRREKGQITLIAGGLDCVLRMWKMQSERHPDLAVYLTRPPADDEQGWDEWVPEIIVEVVSRESRRRDYTLKPRDYLAAGVRECWIVDPLARTATLLNRRGDTWNRRKLSARQSITTGVLPGFKLPLREFFSSLP